MIDETFKKIERRVTDADGLDTDKKAELKGLIETLRTEVTELAKIDPEQSRSIAGFAEVSTHEATREEKQPRLLQHSVGGLGASVIGFEKDHPQLTEIVNRVCMFLSNMGI